jgi:hypothetical protein
MKYRPTILNICVGFFLIGILIYTILNFQELSACEGWGIVAMVGLTVIGLIAGFVDYILQLFFL